MNRLIGLEEKDLSLEIYRIFSLQRALELFRSSKNTLVKPSMWDDPFENYILNATARLSSGERASIEFKDQLYGQCWTVSRDSDAMWRIYSPDKQGIRVRTTVGALVNSLWESSGQFRNLSSFIGKVRYLPQYRLVDRLSRPFEFGQGMLDQTGRGQAETLLVKRREFSHEKEVRLIYFNQDKSYRSNIYQYSIDPHSLIDEIAFDPRLSGELVQMFSRHFEEIGFSATQIRQSPLYQLPELEVRIADS